MENQNYILNFVFYATDEGRRVKGVDILNFALGPSCTRGGRWPAAHAAKCRGNKAGMGIGRSVGWRLVVALGGSGRL